MKGRTGSVGILTSLHTNPYYLQIIDPIERLLSQNGAYIYLCNCENDIDREKKYCDELLRRNIDALIVIETPSLNRPNNFYIQRKIPCPVVLVNQHIKPYGDNYVIRCEQEPGILAVFEHITAHDLFPFLLFITSDDVYSYTLKEKLFHRWQRKQRLSSKDAGIIKSSAFQDVNDEQSIWKTYEIFKDILSSASRPRAILTGNELMALGVLAAARDLSIAVPGELALAGVDNTFLSQICCPALSTIDLRMREVGTLAAELYLSIWKNPDENRSSLQSIPSQFVRRATMTG